MIKVTVFDTKGWEAPYCSVCSKQVGTKYFIGNSGKVCSKCEAKTHKKSKKKAKSKTERKYLKVIARLRGLCYNIAMLDEKKLSPVDKTVVQNTLTRLKEKEYGCGLPFEK